MTRKQWGVMVYLDPSIRDDPELLEETLSYRKQRASEEAQAQGVVLAAEPKEVSFHGQKYSFSGLMGTDEDGDPYEEMWFAPVDLDDPEITHLMVRIIWDAEKVS